MRTSLRIGALVERRYLTQAQPAGTCATLRARCHHVTLIDPETALYEMGDGQNAANFEIAHREWKPFLDEEGEKGAW